MKPFAIIVAIDEMGGIGRDGQLPWRLPGELRHFREVTVGQGNNAVIMGETTWLSLPDKFRPLPDRQNIILSNQGSSYPGATTVASFPEAFSQATTAENIYVIGGASIYRQAIVLSDCQELFITRVQGEHQCDVFFPTIPSNFHLVEKSEPRTEENETYWFERYRRG